MGKPSEPKPVQLFVGLLTGYPDYAPKVREELEERFGEVGRESSFIPFDYTDYYSGEMGEGLVKKFFVFHDLIQPDELPRIKLKTNGIELALAEEVEAEVRRPVNIDPGYVGLSKIVLATTKNYSHRIYLERGIYAEVTLQYRDGEFRPQPWTYPDYRSEKYLEFFEEVRDLYVRRPELA
ncbi:MAG: DUF4416 family protein [Candidatus Bipolaricaulota bacterium]